MNCGGERRERDEAGAQMLPGNSRLLPSPGRAGDAVPEMPCQGHPASPRALAGTGSGLPASHGVVLPAGLGTAGDGLNCDLAGAPPVLRFSKRPTNYPDNLKNGRK